MKGKTNAIVACNGSGFSHPTFWPSKIGENFTPSGNLVITNGQIRRERPTETKATLLGILDDGTLRFFNNETYEKIKNSGTVNTIAFGGMSNYLIRDGVPYLGNGSSAAPRTAFGQIDNNNYVIIVTNARRSTNTPGYHRTLNEITEIGMKLNCRNLINCDGGGSSTLWMNGKTFHYSQARDGGRTMYGDDRFSWGPRPVADAIYFTSLNK